MTEVALPLQKSDRLFLAGNWVKTVVFALVSFGIVAGNFMLEGDFLGKNEVLKANFVDFDYKNDNFLPKNGIIRFGEGEGTEMKIISQKDQNYVMEFRFGKFWGDFSYSPLKLNIIVGKTVLIPSQAVFDVNFRDNRLELNVYDGDVYVGFLPEGANVANYLDPYSQIFVNRLLVPRENQLNVPMGKVTEEIRPLLYSKLVKEFKLSGLTEELKNSEWLKKNLENDKKIFENLRQEFDATELDQGAKVQDGLISNFIFWAEENLTFVPDKKQRMLLTHLFTYLDDAVYYANRGENDKAEASVQAFDNYFFTLPVEFTQSKEFYATFDEYIGRLKIFGPSDKEYKIFKTLLDKKFVAGRDRFEIVNNFWQDIYKSLDNSGILAEDSLNTYYEHFDKTRVKSVNGEVDDEFYRNYLAYQNQLFDNLLLKYPLFYKDGYFAIKNVLEQDLLELYPNGQLKDELKQAFVSNKINFMKRLRKFFFEGGSDVSIGAGFEVKQSKEIYKRLFGEINDFMPKDNSGLAVIKLFEAQLTDMDDFWGYLNTPEYHAKIYGEKHEDRFKVYLQDRQTIWNFVNIKQDVLGEAPKSGQQTIAEIRQEIQKTLKTNEQVSSVEIGEFDGIDDRFVPVNLVLGGYPVEAQYDRDNDSLKDVKVYNEEISDHALKLEGLLNILQQKFGDLAEKQKKELTGGETIETTAQRFARSYIAKKIAALGFNITADNVKISDQENALYRVEDVIYQDYKDIKITFDVLMNGEFVTNIYLVVNGQPQVLNGKFTFEEFKNMIIAEMSLGDVGVSRGADNDDEEEATDGVPTTGVPR